MPPELPTTSTTAFGPPPKLRTCCLRTFDHLQSFMLAASEPSTTSRASYCLQSFLPPPKLRAYCLRTFDHLQSFPAASRASCHPHIFVLPSPEPWSTSRHCDRCQRFPHPYS